MKTNLLRILLLAFLVSTLCVPSAHADPSETCGDNLTWTYDHETDVLTIGGTGDIIIM